MLKPPTTKPSSSGPGSFISKMFEARTQAHIYHLQTKSFSQHKALDDFYNGIVGLTDDLVEQYQGKYDVVKGYSAGAINEDANPIPYFEELSKFVQANRTKSFKQEDSEIQNNIDEIQSLINSTLYKLKKLS